MTECIQMKRMRGKRGVGRCEDVMSEDRRKERRRKACMEEKERGWEGG